MKICSNCGSQHSELAHFCESCGGKLSGKAASSNLEQVVRPTNETEAFAPLVIPAAQPERHKIPTELPSPLEDEDEQPDLGHENLQKREEGPEAAFGSSGDRDWLARRAPTLPPIPKIPEPTLLQCARYAVEFYWAKRKRKQAIVTMSEDITAAREALDREVLELGRLVRNRDAPLPGFEKVWALIEASEDQRAHAEENCTELLHEKTEKTSEHVELAGDRMRKLEEARRKLDGAKSEMRELEQEGRDERAQDSALGRSIKDFDQTIGSKREQLSIEANSDIREQLTGEIAAAESRKLRHVAEQATLRKKRADISARITDQSARLTYLQGQLDSQKRRSKELREEHREKARLMDEAHDKANRLWLQADRLVQQRLIELGLSVSSQRVQDASLAPFYERIAHTRSAMANRSANVERLKLECDAFDRESLNRGLWTLGGLALAIGLFALWTMT